MISNDGVPIELDAVVFDYPELRMTFDGVIEPGLVTAVMGPSGSGKSTLLALIAGFARPSAGRIRIAGRDVTDLPPHERPVSMVFQDNNLFAHLDVARNVGLGISPALRLSPEDHGRIAAALERTGLDGKQARLPRDLSGGERQRVAIARALVRDRPVLLMDEPFASLGPSLRDGMIDLVLDLQAERGLTVVLVTHDPLDARRAAERLVFIEDGRIAASGPTDEFFAGDGPERFRDYIGCGAEGRDLRSAARKTT